MEDFETVFIYNYKFKRIIWWPYLEDVFYIYSGFERKLDEFLYYLNNKEQTIKFTQKNKINKFNFWTN